MDTPPTYQTEQFSSNIFEPAGFDVSLQYSTDPKLQPGDTSDGVRSVLVLEDDPVQQRLLKSHLDALGFRVFQALTIAQAKQQLAENRIDLAILDVQLPDGSGFDLCEALDQQVVYAGLPIIVLSSLTGTDVVRRTRAAGGCYFISKPYDPNVLLAIIEKALQDALD